MTELETMERAKMYLDKLANGIDPLTDLPVSEGDVVNQVRISRCLFFVSDVLRRVLENGGIHPAHTKKTPFVITQEQLFHVQFSREPLRITQLCQIITDAAGQEGMTRLAPSIILEWLESIGMLEKKINAEGKQSRCPTAAGHQIGILEENRSGMHGPYTAVLYSEGAQRFVVDHLLSVLAGRAQSED